MVYDSAGNVRLERVRINGSVLNRILTYDAANQLANVRINNVQVASCLYDHRGLRGRKTLSNPPSGVPAITLYTYDPNGHLFQEIAGSGPNAGQALVTYLWQDDVPAAIVLGPNTPGNPSAQDKLLYLEVDHLNTPRIARDEQKRVVWRWGSDAFGDTAPNEDPDGDGVKTTINLRFAGQYFDAESGLHYNWHRYYDPQVGRYTQPDPIGVEGGVNPYSYAEANPLMYTDPLGLWAWGDPLPQGVVDGCAGFGDGVSLGVTAGIRERMGSNDAVDFSSPEYLGGAVAGVAVTTRGYATGAELSIGRNFRLAPWGNRTGHPTGRYPHYHRRGAPDASGNTPPGQGIGRHRPWDKKSTDKCGCDRF